MKIFQKIVAPTILVLFTILASCSKTPVQPKDKIINRVDLHRFLFFTNELHAANYIYNDNFYTLLTQKEQMRVLGGFYSFFNDFTSRYNKNKAADCDNYSTALQFFADFTVPRQKKTGVSLGEFYYTMDTGEKHAINLVILDDYRLIFVEPQNSREVTLSAIEKKSAELIKFN